MISNPTNVSLDLHPVSTKLDEIGQFLLQYQKYDRPVSLLGGNFGSVLFLAEYGAYKKEEAYGDKAIELIEDSYEHLSKGQVNASFCNGLAGMGWALHYLTKKGLLQTDFNDIHQSIHELIAKDSLRYLREKEYDYLHKGSGAFLYFLELVQYPESRQYLEEAVSLLHKAAVFDGPHIKWQHDPWGRLASYKGLGTSYVLGLAHGVPSLLSILSRVYEKGVSQEKCAELVTGIMSWISSKRLPEGFDSLYPSSETENTPLASSRLGWCYGDLGIARAILTAAKVFDRKDWYLLAEEIYLHTAKRRDLISNRVKDAAICHGSGGISHIFYDAWKCLKNDELLDASNYWMDITLKFASNKDGYCGYQYAGEKAAENTTIFLNGISGIGLVLLNRLSTTAAEWDRMLLMS